MTCTDDPTSGRCSSRKRGILTLALISFWMLFFFAAPWLFGMEQWRGEIDVNTGRYRWTNYYWGICISEEVEETWLSEGLDADHVQPPHWETMIRTHHDLFTVSSHDCYGTWIYGALSIEEVEADDRISVTLAARRVVAEQALAILRRDNGSCESLEAAGDYLSAQASHLRRLLYESGEKAIRADVEDLRSPEDLTNPVIPK